MKGYGIDQSDQRTYTSTANVLRLADNVIETERVSTRKPFFVITSRSGTNALPLQPRKPVLPRVPIARKPVLRWRTEVLQKPHPIVTSSGKRKWVRGVKIRHPYVKWIRDRERSPWVPAKKKKARVPVIRGLDLPPQTLRFREIRIINDGGVRQSTSANSWHVYSKNLSLFDTDDSPWKDSTGPASIFPKRFDSMLDEILAGNYDVNSDLVQAQEKVHGKILDLIKDQSVNLAQALAERKQTAALLGDLADRLLKAVKSVKRFDLKGLYSALLPGSSKNLANDVLAVQFGLRPLINDIAAVSEEFSNPRSKVDYHDIKAGTRVKKARRLVHTSSFKNWVEFVDRVYVTEEIIVSNKYRYRVKGEGFKSLSEMGFTSALGLGWELTPWSFAVDWVLPLGKFLDRIDATFFSEFVYGHETIIRKYYVEYERTYGSAAKVPGWTNVYQVTGGVMTGTASVVRVDRVLKTNFPSIPFPAVKNPISIDHVVDTFALIRQLVGGETLVRRLFK